LKSVRSAAQKFPALSRVDDDPVALRLVGEQGRPAIAPARFGEILSSPRFNSAENASQLRCFER
jgi:hypothetical protein